MKKEIPNVQIYTRPNQKSEYVRIMLSFNVCNVYPNEVADLLRKKFAMGVRAGSFCSYNFPWLAGFAKEEDDPAIKAAAREGDYSFVPGWVRASIGIDNTIGDINRFIAPVREIANTHNYSKPSISHQTSPNKVAAYQASATYILKK